MRIGDYACIVLLTVRIAVVLIGLTVAQFLPACGFGSERQADHSTRTDEPVVTGEPAGYNADDTSFADNVIASDQQGIDLSALVPAHSNDADIVAFAAKSAAARQSDVAVLRALRVQWKENPDTKTGGVGHGAVPTRMVDQSTIAKLNSLHANKFDTLWLQSMLGLDRGAVDLSNAEIASGKNVDAIGVAKRILQARQSEIDQMDHMLGN